MSTLRGLRWGPDALPEFLRAQLAAHGFTSEDAGRCARLINEHHGGAAAASLFVDLGSCKFLEADIDGAIAAWRHAIASQHDAAAARAMLNLGLLYEHLHLHEQALGLLAGVAERNIEPYVAPAAMASARSQVALGQAENAMETMARLAQKLMSEQPEADYLVEALYGLGEVAEHAGRLDRAERSWQVAAASPTSPLQQEAYTRLIQLQNEQGRSHASAVSGNSSEARDQPELPVLLDTAELLLRTGEKRQAAQLLQRIRPGGFGAVDRFRYVDASLMSGRINEAIDELEVLLDDKNEHVQNRALFSLGRVYASYDMLDPAVSMFQRAVASDDPYWMPAASLALGDVLASRGDHAPANEYWSYAAAGSVPGLAEQARDRIAASALAAEADPGAVAPAAHQPEETMATPESEDTELAVQGEQDLHRAEPQLILLDSIDSELGVPSDGGTHTDDAISADSVTDVERLEGGDGDDHVAGEIDAVGERESVESEPVLVVLDDLEGGNAPDGPFDDVVIDMHDRRPKSEVMVSSRESSLLSALAEDGDVDAVHNPYAALAPDVEANDVAPTTRNPYAELAPNFAADDFVPPADVEPGDWESLLGDTSTSERPPSKKRSSAFSRYT